MCVCVFVCRLVQRLQKLVTRKGMHNDPTTVSARKGGVGLWPQQAEACLARGSDSFGA